MEIVPDDFRALINEAEKLKESIRIMKVIWTKIN